MGRGKPPRSEAGRGGLSEQGKIAIPTPNDSLSKCFFSLFLVFFLSYLTVFSSSLPLAFQELKSEPLSHGGLVHLFPSQSRPLSCSTLLSFFIFFFYPDLSPHWTSTAPPQATNRHYHKPPPRSFSLSLSLPPPLCQIGSYLSPQFCDFVILGFRSKDFWDWVCRGFGFGFGFSMHLYVDGFGFLAMVVFEAWAVMEVGLYGRWWCGWWLDFV